LDREGDAQAQRDGGAPIVPGSPAKSTLVARITGADASQIMPPPETHKKLTAVQIETLKQWISEGAEYGPHWSLIAPRRPNPPVVRNEAWIKNPIDRFILAALEKAGLSPAAEADRYTLARRLSLDITGLPPEPDAVERFVHDQSPDAYEKFVDALLGSLHWGEHRARSWLDAARYADTHGIHFDNYREIWSYRDWVIRAFNDNIRFDQFTIEQLAGDLLPNRTLEQQVASGFNRCNITTNEGGVIPEEYLVLYTRDRTETVSQVWMGTTAGCAVCHDHKFDPLSQVEFYKLAAFFNNSTQGAMDGNIKDTPPIVTVPREADRKRFDGLAAEVPAAKQQLEMRRDAARPDFDQWLTTASPGRLFASLPFEVLKFHALLGEGGDATTVAVDGQLRQVALGKPLTWQPGHVAAQALQARPEAVIAIDDVGDFDRDQSFSYGAWVKLTHDGQHGAICARMDDLHDYRGWDLWLENNRVGAHIIHKWPDDAIKVVANTRIPSRQWTHLFITYDGSGKASGVKVYVNGAAQATTVVADSLKNATRTEVPLKIAQRHAGQRLDDALVQDLRIYGRAMSADEVSHLVKNSRAAWLVSKPDRTDGEKGELFSWWLPMHDRPFQELSTRILELEREQASIKSRGTVGHVMQERTEPAMAYVLFRGEYDQRRDAVTPDTPAAMPAWPPDQPKNRIGLANWLLTPEHPLTARVTVNRFWQEVFGTGLVRTAGDFGVAGDLPSHPELLDWLAVEFRESGWDIKQFFKLLVCSATYRQAAVTTPEKLEKDPLNRLLSRGPRFRMDAEMIRDHALAASGLLVRKIGGPSVKPYQPDGVWEAVAMIGSNTRDYRRDSGESLYRRSMYTFWKRSAPPAAMDIFNAPNRETCAVRRERTNTPLQALAALNDPQLVEAARRLAERALLVESSGPTVAADLPAPPALDSANAPKLTAPGEQGNGSQAQVRARIDFITRRLLARPMRPEELFLIEGGLSDLLTYYRSHPDDAQLLINVGESKADSNLDVSSLAAWTMLVNELMNLDEVLNK
jgi:hypothetical protein